MHEKLILYSLPAAFLTFSVYLVVTRDKREGRWRSSVLLTVSVFFIFALLLFLGLTKGLLWPIQMVERISLPYAILWLALVNVFSAAVLVELLTLVMPSWASWPNTKYRMVVGLLWLLILVVTTMGILFGMMPTSS